MMKSMGSNDLSLLMTAVSMATGLGSAFDDIGCAGAVNPQVVVATLDGAKNTVLSFLGFAAATTINPDEKISYPMMLIALA
jgi:hypothetical protein